MKTSGRKTDGEHTFSLHFASHGSGTLGAFFTAALVANSSIATMHVSGSWPRSGSL